MATTIKIGSVQIRDEDYAIQANAILGIRGTGKTTLAKSIAEQMLDVHIPIIVFDPTGVWRYLKRGAKKDQRGYKIVVAGGVEPDLQLTPASAAEIVRAAIKENVSLVIDLYDRKLSKSDWRRIVRDCFRTLMYENEGVRHIFLEEAAEFAPQRVQDGETYAEVEKVVRMGGNASLGITLINQRSQEVNKAVLELCENLVLMRQKGSHAIDAIEKWIDKLDPEYAKTIKGDLPHLSTGRAFVFRGDGAPQAASSNKLHTFHPDRRRPEAIKRAGKSPDVAEFVAALGERLKDKTALDTLESLRARVKVLEKERASEVHVEISPKELHAKCVQRETTLATENATLRANDKILRGSIKRVYGEIAKFYTATQKEFPSVDYFKLPSLKIGKSLTMANRTDEATRKITGQTRKANFVPALQKSKIFDDSPSYPSHDQNEGDSAELTGPQYAALKSMYWLQHEPMTLAKVAFYAGYKPGRYFSDRIGELRTKGLVNKGSFQLTEAGLEHIGEDVAGKPTGRQLRETVRGMLTGPQNAVLDALLESAGPMSLSEIAEATGHAEGRYLSDRVGELRTLELVVGNDKTGGAQPSPFFRE